MPDILLYIIVIYGMVVGLLSLLYVALYWRRVRARLYMFLFVVDMIVTLFYVALIFGSLDAPTLLSAVIGRLVVILLLSVFVAFVLVDL